MMIDIQNEEMELLPERAIFWPNMELLLIADIGCAFENRTFLEGGLKELEHLKAVVSKRPVKRVVLMGDVAPPSRSFDKELLLMIKAWSQSIKCPFYIASPRPAGVEIKEYGVAAWAEPLIIPPFAFSKEPLENDKYFTFSGHIHPHVALRKDGERNSFPCFQIKQRLAILPSFTGDAPAQQISWTSEERVFAIDGHNIISI